jgi:hypothetical protein
MWVASGRETEQWWRQGVTSKRLNIIPLLNQKPVCERINYHPKLCNTYHTQNWSCSCGCESGDVEYRAISMRSDASSFSSPAFYDQS